MLMGIQMSRRDPRGDDLLHLCSQLGIDIQTAGTDGAEQSGKVLRERLAGQQRVRLQQGQMNADVERGRAAGQFGCMVEGGSRSHHSRGGENTGAVRVNDTLVYVSGPAEVVRVDN